MSEEVPATTNPVAQTDAAPGKATKGQIVNQKKVESLLWRMATIKVILFSIASLWTCWATATSQLNMSLLGVWDWVNTIGGCFAAWCFTMLAFIDKSASQLSAGKIPGLENGNHDGNHETKE